jgi:uncharacterized protein (DUF111 family)
MFEAYDQDIVTRIETNLDDLSPEILGGVQEQLLELGVLDTWFTAIQMKKHRPGVMLSVLCQPALAERVAELLFKETSAFGLRVEEVRRVKLFRRFISVTTDYGEVSVKVGERNGEIIQVAPEYQVCAELAKRSGVPIRELFRAANEAAHHALHAEGGGNPVLPGSP